MVEITVLEFTLFCVLTGVLYWLSGFCFGKAYMDWRRKKNVD